MKVICIVQARVGSTRLPRKVLKKICGKTVLEHGIHRLKRVKNIDEIVIATTTLEKDNAIAEEATRLNVKCFRGSEDDVLSRYYYAAKENKADVVVRVTSDCPLIDSNVSQETIQLYLNNTDKYDYISNTLKRTFPRGLDTEVFSFKILEKVFYEASIMKHREHVTAYILENQNIFKLGYYKNDIDYSKLRWTLDTKEDFELIKSIFKYLYPQKGDEFNIKDILLLYKNHPELKDINKDIEQKQI